MNTITMIRKSSVTQGLVRQRVRIWFAYALLAVGAIIASAGVFAQPTVPMLVGDVTDGYSNCAFESGMNGRFYRLTVKFKKARGYLGSKSPDLYGRGFMLYHYDKDGRLYVGDAKRGNRPIHFGVALDDVLSNNFIPSGGVDPFALYYWENSIGFRVERAWQQQDAHTASVRIISFDSMISTPANYVAVAIRAANISTNYKRPLLLWSDAYGEIVADNKMAYIVHTEVPGVCHIITDPNNPPPMEARINMNAPDWNLGELQPGAPKDRPFSNTAEQLCFTYDGPKLAGLRYAINATNQNGLSGNGWYQLTHLTSPSDKVPYRVVLLNADTNSEVELPNTSNVVSTLANTGRECFRPTFKTNTPKAAKEGDYADVLTFTVVARP
ncbi:hypothetical protein [Achromobacter sp.]|uniref:hypothetical protein n=1 Tax=Achromobacter sp. TaxID=134375 RepID=UPI003C73F334